MSNNSDRRAKELDLLLREEQLRSKELGMQINQQAEIMRQMGRALTVIMTHLGGTVRVPAKMVETMSFQVDFTSNRDPETDEIVFTIVPIEKKEPRMVQPVKLITPGSVN